MRWSDILKRLGTKSEKVSYKNVTCKNCETHFSGHYCPECGQAVRESDKPFSFIFYNFVGDFFDFDTRFFRTFKALILKPGFLSREYFEGRRIRFAPPFRIFIFVSFILFLLLQIYTNRGLTTVLDSGFNEGKVGIDSISLALVDSIINEVNSKMDSSYTAINDSTLNEKGTQADTVDTKNSNFKITLDTFRDSRDLRDALNKYADYLEKEIENETDQREIVKKREYIRLCRSPELVTTRVLEYMSWAFFLLLPVFALILKLVYIRQKHNYIRHLVFSVHIHSFLFIVFIIITLIYMSMDGILKGLSVEFHGNIRGITGIIILLIPIYIIVAIKRFYGQKLGKVILKFFVVSFLYYTVFIIVVGVVMLNALSII